jgi:RraA family protein
VRPPADLVGFALTVRTRPGDNLLVHKAIDMAVPGQVIVVDAGGDLTNAIIGELMVMHAQSRGIAGIVIHGAIRDSDFVRSGSFPVYALGVTHRGPYKDGPGEINHPISLAGMVVNPGDIMVGDADGIVAIPVAEAPKILEDTLAVAAKEAKAKEAIRNGAYDRRWVDETLKARGLL